MDRDPTNHECTRDPMFLLQIGNRQWTQIPDGLGDDSESVWVENDSEVEDWVRPFLDDSGSVEDTEAFWAEAEKREGDHGWPLVHVEWRTELVFLTRSEAEAFGDRHKYRWQKWRVYCVPAEGTLAKILNAIPD